MNIVDFLEDTLNSVTSYQKCKFSPKISLKYKIKILPWAEIEIFGKLSHVQCV